MGTLFSALDLGRSGLHAARIQLDVSAHNIANVNTEGYSRQRVDLTTNLPLERSYGYLGRGVRVEGIRRLRDQFLDTVFRDQVPGLGRAEARATYFTQMESVFLEPTDLALGTRLNLFFDSLNDFANNVESIPVRQGLLSEGQAIAGSINQVAQRLRTLRTNANEEVRALVPEINSLSSQIAELNGSIRKAELTGQQANDLRDRRDVLIDDLARIVAIDPRERDDGQIDIQLGGEVLVDGVRARVIEAVADPTIDPDRPDLLRVQFADFDRELRLFGGELLGAIQMRDTEIAQLENRMDELARGLIRGINSIHSQGNGLRNYAGPLVSSNGVTDATTDLNAAGLPFPVQNGGFDINVYDTAGNLISNVTIPIQASAVPGSNTDMNNIVALINASSGATGVTASVDAENRLVITPGANTNISFANDTSGVLTALGVHGFFTGDSALDIGVNQDLVENPELISSGFSLDALETGDNSAALAMAAIRNSATMNGNTQTLNEFYQCTIVGVGVDARSNEELLTVEQNFNDEFVRRRQETSGVSLDEEATFLIQFQRAFEGSARVITVADRMLETLINLVV